MSRPAAFLDRDGTLIHDANFIRDPAAVRVLPTVAEALRLFADRGYARIVISNQSGVARNLLSENDVALVNETLRDELAHAGASVDAFYYCPHYEDGCTCRKPLPGLVDRAIVEHDLTLAGSVVIGDRAADIGLAQALGIPGILIEGEQYPYAGPPPALRAHTLLEAARWTVDRVGV